MTATLFGPLLRRWRRVRRMTQQDLALDAEVSTRHLSCLETGKARPSREMVLVLASALDVPLRERNALLGAAGFAPAYRDTDLADPELAPVVRLLDWMMERHAPYPAFAIDHRWQVLRRNAPAQRMAALLGQPQPANAMLWCFDPAGLHPFIANWSEFGGHMLRRLARDAAQDDGAAELLAAALSHGTAPTGWRRPLPAAPALLVPLELGLGGARIRLFSTITTLGTPQDATLADLRIETVLPADDASDAALRALLGAG